MTGNDTGRIPNGTVVESGDAFVVVEQGPEWLVQVVYDPPAWLLWVVAAALVAVVGAIAWALRRVDVEDELPDLIEEWSEIVLIVGSIAVATKVLVAWGSQPYVVDVIAGTALGYAFAKVALAGCRRLARSAPAVADGNNH